MSIPLIDAAKSADGWTFDNGRGFPGATAKLEAMEGGLRLIGDFTGGGGYVQAQRPITAIDVRVLSSTTAREAQWTLGPAKGGTWLTVRAAVK